MKVEDKNEIIAELHERLREADDTHIRLGDLSAWREFGIEKGYWAYFKDIIIKEYLSTDEGSAHQDYIKPKNMAYQITSMQNIVPDPSLCQIVKKFKSNEELAGNNGYCNPVFAEKIADWWTKEVERFIQEFLNRILPEENKPKLGSENQEVYVAYANGYNDCRKGILTKASNEGVNIK
jgi:hypothetical protein